MELSKKEVSAIEVLTWEVEGLEVVDKSSCSIAQELRNKCHDRAKSIKDFCSESIKAAHKAHKAAKAQEATFLEPIEKLKDILTAKLRRYADEEMAKERAAQAKLDELRKKAAESAVEGQEEALPPIPVTIPTALDKGWRDLWSFEVVDRSLIPLEYFILDEKYLSTVVKTMKDKTNIPGIKVIKSKIPVSSR